MIGWRGRKRLLFSPVFLMIDLKRHWIFSSLGCNFVSSLFKCIRDLSGFKERREGKVKVKCTLVQALRLCTGRTAYRENRGIALPFHHHGTIEEGGVVNVTARPFFTTGKVPVPIVQEAGWGPGPVWTGGKSRPTGIRSPDLPARSQSVNRLSYPAQKERRKALPHNDTGLLTGRCSADDRVSDHLSSISKEILIYRYTVDGICNVMSESKNVRLRKNKHNLDRRNECMIPTHL